MHFRSRNIISSLRDLPQARLWGGTTSRSFGSPSLPWIALTALLLSVGPRQLAAQESADWRTSFAAGEAARKAGDAEGYARWMAAAVAAMPPGLGNRPFAEYQAARASAMLGDTTAAVAWLAQAWDEGIESLMITFAEADPAFDGVRDAPAFQAVLGRPATMSLDMDTLAPGLYLLRGAGANVVASAGRDGLLLVDTGYRAALPALRRALTDLGQPQVDALVITHPHEDHWGAIEDLAPDAVVYAHPRTAAALSEPYEFMEGVVLPPRPPVARPDVLVRDTTFPFNGQDVRIFPVEAHTNADIAVYFAGAGVLDLGDAWLAGNPLVFPGSSDPDGFLDRLDGFLASLPAGTVVLGGHDDPTDVATVRDRIGATRACMTLVRQSVADGETLDETVARAEGRFTAPWVGFFYRVFTRPGTPDGTGAR